VIVVTLEQNGKEGRGEAAGIYYKDETPASMIEQISARRTEIEAGVSRQELHALFGPGGARNALDCAMWDLEAKLRGVPVWRLAGLPPPRPLVTTFTCSAEAPEAVAQAAVRFKSLRGARAIKLKLTGEPVDAERVRAVRAALPDVWLCVDANQGFTRASFEELLPILIECRVALIEQPFPRDKDHWMDGLRCPIPIAADESLQVRADVSKLVGRFDAANIKLDKCGGLTQGFEIARSLVASGLDVMVGSMGGTSLAIAPIFLVGQQARYVDLDGPALLEADRPGGVIYRDGEIMLRDSKDTDANAHL
jgi:L-alanine-DL-glutamate epimerase-like enolase superfamily enzyme